MYDKNKKSTQPGQRNTENKSAGRVKGASGKRNGQATLMGSKGRGQDANVKEKVYSGKFNTFVDDYEDFDDEYYRTLAKNKKQSGSASGKSTNGKKTINKNINSRSMDSRPMSSRSTDNRSTDNKGTDRRSMNNRSTDNKGTDRRSTYNRSITTKSTISNSINNSTIKNTVCIRSESGKSVSDKNVYQKGTFQNDAYGHSIADKNSYSKKVSGKTTGPERMKNNGKKGTCPYSRECGGCNYMQQSYDIELMEKQKTVEKLINKYCKVESIIGMKSPSHYRNKVHVVFDHDKKGNPLSGVYEEGSHRIVAVNQCLIHNQKADAIINTIRDMLKSFKMKTYDEDTGYGLLRHVLIRAGYISNEIMVVLVLASPILPSKSNFVKALRDKHPEISTIVINVNDKKTSMVLGDKEQVIYGKGYIEDSLCGKVFRISPKSFYQVNPAQTEILYNKAIELAELKGSETVIDAYCGTGTIGLIASDHAKRVIGVELNKDAVHDANTNAKRNNAQNIEFYNNDAGVFLSQMAEQQEKADVVFLDPPRSGSSEQFMDSLVRLKPKKVVYISCNPVSLERDLGYLTKKGYRASKAVPVDMFPWTGHVETVILMTRCGKNDK